MAQPHPSIVALYDMTPEDYVRLRPVLRDMDYCDIKELQEMYPSLSKEDWQKIRHAEQKLRSKQAKKS
jgi:hypothetical protein